MSCHDPSRPRSSDQKRRPPTDPAAGSVTAKTNRSASSGPGPPAQVRSATGLGVETWAVFFLVVVLRGEEEEEEEEDGGERE